MPGRLLFAAVLTCALLAALPAAASAASCKPPRYPGAGYFTSLRVTAVSCATGRKVMLAHYRCRTANGGRRGRCERSVLRYRCTERREAIRTQFNSRVTCRRGSARIVFTYQQNT